MTRALLDHRKVKDYYARYAVDGRAVLLGTVDEPDIWLTLPDPERTTYCLCFSRREKVVFLDGAITLQSMRRRAHIRIRIH